MPKNPLAEVFGYPTDNDSQEARDHRRLKLCPFNNIVSQCTNDKKADPLGVCSVQYGGKAIATCPVRFNESWKVVADAASFYFPNGTAWEALREIRLRDSLGGSAGNIDYVLVSYDDKGRVLDFGALEIQAMYCQGNVRNPFEHYMNHKTSSHSGKGQVNQGEGVPILMTVHAWCAYTQCSIAHRPKPTAFGAG